MFRKLLLSALFFLSFSASAADYYWVMFPYQPSWPSADAACHQGDNDLKSTSLQGGDANGNFQCKIHWYDGSPDEYLQVGRRGDSCPEGKTYNAVAGSCDAPAPSKCSDKKGKVVKSFHWLSSTDEPSATISVDGCAASISGFSICKTASPSTFSCSGTATWTGDELDASGGSGTTCEGDDCHKDDPQSGTKNDPCIKQDTGAGYTCTSTVEDSKAGETSCGTANGVYVCTPITEPAKTTISTSVQQVQTANPDGSLTTKNVTTTTKTTCVASKCTSTSYTTTTNGGTSSSGMPTGGTSTCTGTGCPSQTGSGSVGGGGGGDSKDDGKASAQKDCAKPVVCDGDIYQCAILNQEFISMCSARELPTEKDLADLKASSAAFQAKADANQAELDQSANSVLSQFKAAAAGSGGSTSKCLPDYNYSVMGRSIEMKFSSVCDYLAGIRYAILAICYLIAARRMSREL